LRQHPGVKFISRDRGGSYAEGARLGAPDAVQIADRFHLLKNLTESLDQVLLREHHVLESVAKRLQAPEVPARSAGVPEPVVRHRQPRQVRESAIRRERRQARSAAVLEAQHQGQSLRTIATRLGLARNTVRKYVRLEAAPEPAPRRPRPGKVTPFEAYLRERWNAGEQDSGVLFRELCTRGYTGSASTVRLYLSHWRSGPPRSGRRAGGGTGAPAPPPTYTWTARRTRWLLIEAIKEPSVLDEAYCTALLEQRPLDRAGTSLRQRIFPAGPPTSCRCPGPLVRSGGTEQHPRIGELCRGAFDATMTPWRPPYDLNGVKDQPKAK